MNPHSDVEVLIRLWPVFLGVLGLTAWLIRLESRTLSNREKIQAVELSFKKELDDLKEEVRQHVNKVWDKIDTIKDQNTEILKSISRLEGKLERKGVHNENV
jgi:uncharacterized membrane-anchored protein YhcB (DUF1043 family)